MDSALVMFLVLDRAAPATQTGPPSTPCASCSFASVGSGVSGGSAPSPDAAFCTHPGDLPVGLASKTLRPSWPGGIGPRLAGPSTPIAEGTLVSCVVTSEVLWDA